MTNMIQQCTFTAQKANLILSCIKSSMVSRLREETLPSYYSALVRHHLEHCIQHWGPQHEKDEGLCERLEEIAGSKHFRSVCACLCEEKEQVRPCLC